MKQYKITSENLNITDSNTDCYLDPNDPIHELKIAHYLDGLGSAARLAEYKAKLPENQVNTSNAGQIQREQNIKPGTEEWFKLWFKGNR